MGILDNTIFKNFPQFVSEYLIQQKYGQKAKTSHIKSLQATNKIRKIKPVSNKLKEHRLVISEKMLSIERNAVKAVNRKIRIIR